MITALSPLWRGRQQGDVLDLTLWLMSCRVLKRGMEDAMMDTVVAEAAARGVKTIVGHYYPTAKKRHGARILRAI